MDIPSARLMAEHYPDVPLRTPLEGNTSLLSTTAAERLIGYRPRYSWRDR
jgi:hypothetical protein